jgi:hypothetical protein
MTIIHIRVDDQWINVTSAGIGTPTRQRPSQETIHVIGGVGPESS